MATRVTIKLKTKGIQNGLDSVGIGRSPGKYLAEIWLVISRNWPENLKKSANTETKQRSQILKSQIRLFSCLVRRRLFVEFMILEEK